MTPIPEPLDEHTRLTLAHQILARARTGLPGGIEVAVFVFPTDAPEDFTVVSTGAHGAHARLRRAVQGWLRPSGAVLPPPQSAP